MNTLKRLRPDHWAWLHAKAALITWAVLIFLWTPDKVAFTLGTILASCISAAVIVGIGTSVAGLFMSMSKYTRSAKRGIRVELAGLWVAISGPIVYCITQFVLAFGPEGDQRTALVAFAYSLCALMLCRIVIVRVHQKRGEE